ncbi:hypothetical protein [Mucilaginibacter sp. KACC 22063]|uniref:hypothetical protein n=1 Tax=Mucilaginibacter sp. KACC 22063 TaxID=3025666 RepID=UPI0023657507|nr:hypothetical protein [Mucilaginibacter sp. KACC 22063]WDF53720.1 hypothetical protein PQ461_12270 [Mucilaginibacter sp. KACC 22063]
MNYLKCFIAIALLTLSACKKEKLQSSGSIVGQWRLNAHYETTIAGTRRTAANQSDLTIIKFTDTQYIQSQKGQVIESGNYQLAKNYNFYDDYHADALLVNNVVKGVYAIKRGNQDTLSISMPFFAVDAGASDEYVRISN